MTMTIRMSRVWGAVGLAALGLLMAVGCGSSKGTGPGDGGGAVGGRAASTGGSGTGGALASGGRGSGGVPSSGTGGGASGGANGGGGSSATGGVTATGSAGARGGSGGNGGNGAMPGSGGSGTGGRPATGGAGGGGGGAVQCPMGQIWCPGCANSPGACHTGGCPAGACAPDGGAPDAAGAKCADVTTLAACDLRADCHAVYVDSQVCGCATLGCCAHFSRCADGDRANCTGPAACEIVTPHCEGPYVVSYVGTCYEGCTRATECAP